MTLTELITEVYGITNRPDKDTLTKSMVKAATLKMHQCDFFRKDLLETVIDFGTAAYFNSFQTSQVSSLWRALKYIRRIDTTSGLPVGPPLAILDSPDVFMNEYQQEKMNVAYEAGLSLNIRTEAQIQKFVLGCYLNPNVTDAGFNSWIANSHPYALIFEAAAWVLKDIGKLEEEQSYRLLGAEQMQMIKISNIQTVGE